MSGAFAAALFGTLVISQLGHVGEHAAQMIQLHVLGLAGAQARGIIGAFDIEWVHFAWNTWVIVAVVALVFAFPRNRWLRVALALSAWHELEHVVIMWTHLTTGAIGSPGLLSRGGIILGGVPLQRPDLHFLFNLIEVVPLLAAYIAERHVPFGGMLARQGRVRSGAL